METSTKIYSDNILFDDDNEDIVNDDVKDVVFNTKIFEKARNDLDQNIFEPNYIVKKMYFVTHKTDDIYEHFKFDLEPIGVGSFGTVYRAVEKLTGEVKAIKIIDIDHIKNKSKYNNFINEVTSLKTLDHPNIVKIYDVYENENRVYLVQEYCNGGELFNYIAQKDSLNESEAAIFFKQMVGAIIYCHKNRICHRDLKPDNFMLSIGDGMTSVKLIDFGISRNYFKLGSKGNLEILRMQSIAGTTPYMAPEIFKRNYSNSWDTWSLGVILYVMLSGYPPFGGYNEEIISENIMKLNFNFEDEIWEEVSISAKVLISKILTNEMERITPKEILNDEWLKEAHNYK